MRNLEECRAEVFRRSEARIRARKRRNIAILTACVPLVLCVALAWAAGLPGAERGAAEAIPENAWMPAAGGVAVDVGQSSPPGSDDMLYGNVGSKDPGVKLRVTKFDPENGGTLTVVWENRTEYEVTFGTVYKIQRWEEDRWVSCQRWPDLAFDAIGYLLMPGQTRTEQYRLACTYDVSSPGTYRFETECYVYTNPNAGAKCVLSVEFTIQ